MLKWRLTGEAYGLKGPGFARSSESKEPQIFAANVESL